MQTSFLTNAFVLLGFMPRIKNSGSHRNCGFNFWRNLHNVSHRGRATHYFHQQRMRAPVPPYSHHHFLVPDFFI